MGDLYEILGVDRGVNAEELKRAYRKKARESHPDAGGDEEHFKQVQHAYQILSDAQTRARYDRTGDDGTGSAGAGGQGDPFGFGAAGFGGLGDVIDAFFGGSGFSGGGGGGGGGRQRRNQPGRDVLVRSSLTLEEVATGVKRPVEMDVAAVCDQCTGSGSKSTAAPVACRTCSGTGQTQRIVRTAFGQLSTAAVCSSCDGSGRTVSDPCEACHGDGRRPKNRSITVDIPAGVKNGDRLRVTGGGEAGRHGAPSGDLYVEVEVAEHDIFVRDGRDLWCEVRVPMTQAALGATLKLPMLDGSEQAVVIPPGTQPSNVLRVKRAGLPGRGGGGLGDLLVRVQVEVPTNLAPEERELLKQVADMRGDDVSDKGRGLFDRLREAFG